MVDDDTTLRKMMNYSNPASDDENCSGLKRYSKKNEKRRRKSLLVDGEERKSIRK
jgi:hypothetical protein